MKLNLRHFLILFVLFVTGVQAQTGKNNLLLFDDDWVFHRGGAQGAERPTFDDSKWRRVDLPHDWSIEDLPGTNSPFVANAISAVNGGFTTGGTGWYRKSFTVSADQKGKRIDLQFDGVYMNAEIWLNGQYLGNHPYGYTSFWFDVTEQLKFGEKNILAIKVENEGDNSRWYSGSGIYRHVWLKTTEPVHVAQWGTYLTTPQVTSTSATVHAKTNVVNQSTNASDVLLITRILNPEGKEIGKSESSKKLEAGASLDFDQDVKVQAPELWSTESPLLYTAITEVHLGQKLSDRTETKFGIRTISFDAVNGFRLNGKSLKLKGGCVHHDNGVLGAKAFDRAEERRVELLKASGFNAIRSAHNPPSPAFLDACDRLGMLVIDEAFDMWKDGKNPFDYHLYFDQWWKKDVDAMVLRDRNHPSVIFWSIGNEIPGGEKPEVASVAKMLADHIRNLEPTRPVAAAVNSDAARKGPFSDALDIVGYNYALDGYEADHKTKPQRVMMATESYPLEAFQYWNGVVDHPWVIGDFVWTAFDYIGEASIGWRGYLQEQNFYPWNLAFCGDIDICGWKRPQSFYRDVLWKDKQLSIFVQPPTPSFAVNPHKETWSKWNWLDAVADWNWTGYENKPIEVSVYSSCDQVELFLNGKSLGKAKTDRSNQYIAKWSVPFQAGVLRAVGYVGTEQVTNAQLRTASAPVQLKLSADRTTIKSGGQDLSYVTVQLLDAAGVRNPKSEQLVKFELEGPGQIVGVGNGNPVSTDSYQQPQRKAWQGRCLVVVKSGKEPGTITLKASSVGVKPASITIAAKSQ
ncbi:MAG: beta-galactosidase [Blastocatellia bacterium]|nr:beta-galactosidase [Blastocatellia bacterium]